MSNDREFLEENAGRLIQSAFGPEARPRPVVRQRMLQRLLAEQRAQSERADLPDGILAALVGLLVLIGVWLSTQSPGFGFPIACSLPLTIAAWLLYLNLGALPLAGIIIVIRRRKCHA